MFKLTPYHVVVSNYPSEGQCILYSTLDGSAMRISESLYHQIFLGMRTQDVDKLPLRLRNILIHSFLIRDLTIHQREVIERIEYSVTSPKRLALTSLTTTRCNFRCLYCYQNGILDRESDMSIDTVLKVLSWLEQKIKTIHPTNFELHLYGGEPLLNPVALWALLDGARFLCLKYGVVFGAYITTNGYFLDQTTAMRLATSGLKTALVSLDGPPLTHDYRRPLNCGKGTFYHILKNIIESAQSLRICVRINIDRQNCHLVPNLLELLVKYNLQKYILIDLELISPILFASTHLKRFLFNVNDDMQAISNLWEVCAQHGFRIFGAMPIEGACEHKSINTYTVDPIGRLYECPGFVGIDEFCIGNVGENMPSSRTRSGLINCPWLECIECAYLPICQGGCRMCNYVTKNEIKTRYCKQHFFKHSYPSFIRAKYTHKSNSIHCHPSP